MPQSLARTLLHLIFSTKHRQPVLSAEVQGKLFPYIGGILRERESPSLCIGGHVDHVHILFLLSKNLALAKVVEDVKKVSSKWIKTQGVEFHDFHWQNGYGSFSVSQSNAPAVTRYIQNQETHHRRRTYQEELREFLRKHEVEFDERYLWD